MQIAATEVKDDALSPGLVEFLESLSADERASLISVLRNSNTFLAEDIGDVMAILQDLSTR